MHSTLRTTGKVHWEGDKNTAKLGAPSYAQSSDPPLLRAGSNCKAIPASVSGNRSE
ncbi:hypothetical protein STEG23_006886, partial [Scotinomys teguina]